MSNGTRMINGVEFTLMGCNNKECAQKSAKAYRTQGYKVRLIKVPNRVFDYWIYKSV